MGAKKDMEKVYAVRVRNLRQLVEMTEGGAVRVAEAMGYRHRSFISQMAGANPTRRITEKTARAIEDALGLHTGWMDISRGS